MLLDPNVFYINVLFILLTTPIAAFSGLRIMNYKSKTISDYVICLIYVFNCFPVLLDLILGIPKEVYWYRKFEIVLGDFSSCLIYNIYIFLVMICMFLYAYKVHPRLSIGEDDFVFFKSRIVERSLIGIVVVGPILYLFAKYGISSFIEYEPLGMRGIDDGDRFILNQFIVLSIFIAVRFFFKRKRRPIHWISLFLLFFVMMWINGKRFIIVTILEEVIFMYQYRKTVIDIDDKRINMKLIIVFIFIGLILLSIYYMTNIRVDSSSNYVYGMLRVDFGRDDVTKYVIREDLLDGHKILDYPGQTFLSLIFFWVPRGLWPNKPYPHFQYLTASLLDVDLHAIPAGTTPSIFEMSICNFGILGIPVSILILMGVCLLGDHAKKMDMKLFYLLFATMLLTQSVDFLAIIIPFVIMCFVLRKVGEFLLNKSRGNI